MTKKLITREKYEKALHVVEAYKKQNIEISSYDMLKLKKVISGDYLECLFVGPSQKKVLTKGKFYQVISTESIKYNGRIVEKYFIIRDDKNNLKTYKARKNQFKIIPPPVQK